MFGFLTPVRNNAADPLTDVAAAHSFWQSLPKDDPIAAREAVCKALAAPIARGGSSFDRLQALLVLDQYAREIFDALLANDVAGGPQASSAGSRSWQAALELCRRFSRVYGQFLRLMRENREFESRRDCRSLVLLRFFRHRKRELLLRPFSDEGAATFCWREIHEAYRFAESHGLLHESLPIERHPSPSAPGVTLEREYVHVLIQDLMNGGNFSPGNAYWVSHRVACWCAGMVLTPDSSRSNDYRFVVDSRGDAGLVRSNAETADSFLCLDMAPLLKSIRDEISSVSDATDSLSQVWSSERRRRLRALQKVNALCAAERPVIVRRGERARTAMTVGIVMSLPQILREVRASPEPVPNTCTNAAITELPSVDSDSAWRLTMVDQSDSGCRLHGPARATNPTVPGALIAFREDASAPWNLAVVRRVRKRLAGRRIEIGAEYLGKGPQVVVVVAGSDATPDQAADTRLPRFAGLYVPESTESPLLPIKTLILPPCGLSPGDRLFLRSGASVHTIRLKQPLEERGDFVWSPFEILDYCVKEEPLSSQAISQAA